MPQHTTVFLSDDADIQKALARMTAAMAKLQDQNAKLAEASKRGSQQQQSMFEKGLEKLGAMATGYLTVQGAIQLVNNELQHTIDLQRKSAATQISEAGAQSKLLRNVSAGERELAIKSVEQISSEQGLSRKDVLAIASEAVSAKGVASVKDAMDAVRAAIRIAPEDVPEATAIAGGLLDVASLTGTTDAEANLGFLLALQEESRIAKLQPLTEHIVPAMTGIKESGDTATQAAALGVAFTNVLKDREGRVSGTASLQLAGQLREFMPEFDTFKRDKQGKRVVDVQGTGLKSTVERIKFLQDNALEAERFLADANFEQKAMPFVEALLTKGDSEIARNYRDLQQRLPTAEQAKPMAGEKFGAIRREGVQQTAQLERRITGTAESMLAKDLEAGRVGVSSEGLQKVMQASGAGWMETKAAAWQFDIARWFGGKNATEAFSEAIRYRIHEMEVAGLNSMERLQIEGKTDAPKERIDELRKYQESRLSDLEKDKIADLRKLIDDIRKENQPTGKTDRTGSGKLEIVEVPVGPVLPLDKIPKLARGGIVEEATFAFLGEGGPEAVVPLDRLRPPLPLPAESRDTLLPVHDTGRDAGSDSNVLNRDLFSLAMRSAEAMQLRPYWLNEIGEKIRDEPFAGEGPEGTHATPAGYSPIGLQMSELQFTHALKTAAQGGYKPYWHNEDGQRIDSEPFAGEGPEGMHTSPVGWMQKTPWEIHRDGFGAGNYENDDPEPYDFSPSDPFGDRFRNDTELALLALQSKTDPSSVPDPTGDRFKDLGKEMDSLIRILGTVTRQEGRPNSRIEDFQASLAEASLNTRSTPGFPSTSGGHAEAFRQSEELVPLMRELIDAVKGMDSRQLTADQLPVARVPQPPNRNRHYEYA